jgi:predicted RNA-binding Zn ribbon-like protein
MQYATLGGHVVLDFVNTVDWRLRAQPVELLASFEALLDWGRQVGWIDEQATASLRAVAAARPREASAELARIRTLREAIYHALTAAIDGNTPSEEMVDLLDGAIRTATAQRELSVSEGRFSWAWPEAQTRLDGLRARMAASAVDLLLSPDLGRVRQCADSACGWLFLDRSRNRSRRWCSMSACGNRAKGRRFRERQADA